MSMVYMILLLMHQRLGREIVDFDNKIIYNLYRYKALGGRVKTFIFLENSWLVKKGKRNVLNMVHLG